MSSFCTTEFDLKKMNNVTSVTLIFSKFQNSVQFSELFEKTENQNINKDVTVF